MEEAIRRAQEDEIDRYEAQNTRHTLRDPVQPPKWPSLSKWSQMLKKRQYL